MRRIFYLILMVGIIIGFYTNKQLYAKKEIDMELVMLVDDSGSMKKNDPNNVRIYVLYYFSDLLKGKAIKLHILRFGGSTEEVFTGILKEKFNPELFAKAIDKFKSSEEYTDYTDGLIKALKILRKSSAKEKLCFLVTDGKLDPDPENSLYMGEVNIAKISEKQLTTTVINEYKKNNIKLNVIGLSKKVPKKLLTKISKTTGGNFYLTYTRKSMKKGFKKLMNLIIDDVSKEYEKACQTKLVINKKEIEKKANEFTTLLSKKGGSRRKKVIKKVNKNYGKVVFVMGKVLIKRGKSKIKEDAKIGTKIYAGDLIKSYGTGRATISLPTGVLFQVKGNSIVSISKFLKSNKKNESKIDMLYGWMKAKVKKFSKKNNNVIINTPTAVVGVRGTYFETSASENLTQVKVFEGSVVVKDRANKHRKQIVRAGYRCSIKRGEGVSTPTAISTADTGESDNDTTAPIITVIKPIGNYEVSLNELYNLQFIVTDNNLSKVLINGIEISGVSSGSMFTYPLTLTVGLNSIEITAEDNNGNSATVTKKIEYKFMPPNPPTR